MNNSFNFEETLSEVTSALIYSNTPLWESQYVPAIELILRLHARGIPLTHLTCKGALNSCPANPFHELKKCISCRVITRQAEKSLIPEEVRVEELSVFDEIAVPYFDSQREFKEFRHGKLPAGELAYSQLVDDASDLNIPLSTLNLRGRKLLSEAINLYDQSLKIMVRDSIQTVFAWNGRRSSDGPVLYAARQLGLKAYSFSSGGTPEKFFFQENSLHSIEEWSKSISSYASKYEKSFIDMEAEAKEFFSNQRFGNRISYANSFFGNNFSQKYISKSESSKKLLVIFTSSQWETINYFENSILHPDLQDPYRLIQRILEEKLILDKYKVVVRWHPNLQNAGKTETERVQEIIEMTPSIEHVKPESKIDSYSLLLASDIVLTTGSTMGVEANFYQKPSILLGTALYMNLNVCHIPTDYDELLNLLLKEVTVHSRSGSVLYGSFFAMHGFDIANFSVTGDIYTWKNESLSALLNRRPIATRIIKFIYNSIGSWYLKILKNPPKESRRK